MRTSGPGPKGSHAIAMADTRIVNSKLIDYKMSMKTTRYPVGGVLLIDRFESRHRYRNRELDV